MEASLFFSDCPFCVSDFAAVKVQRTHLYGESAAVVKCTIHFGESGTTDSETAAEIDASCAEHVIVPALTRRSSHFLLNL